LTKTFIARAQEWCFADQIKRDLLRKARGNKMSCLMEIPGNGFPDKNIPVLADYFDR